ncbi:MAG: aspartate/glutamate racemase family protein [Chloroflexi bacterium]|nr:aspartate/glutamate racemase family protein [Chloroflexota bacterium]
MKTIGLLGGMSWESSLEYYRIINESVKERLGGLHSAQCMMFSFDFAEIETLQTRGDWASATGRMIEAAQQLERGGAECVVICTNTMHRMADEVQAKIDIPLIHIADATAQAIQADGLSQVGLLGTRYTMEQAFYKGRLLDRHGLNVMIPDEPGRTQVHEIIYDELVLGEITDSSREVYRKIIQQMVDVGAEGIILGCTEIGLLIRQAHSPVPVYDTTYLHAVAAVNWALT